MGFAINLSRTTSAAFLLSSLASVPWQGRK
jgi:hypothetical protein